MASHAREAERGPPREGASAVAPGAGSDADGAQLRAATQRLDSLLENSPLAVVEWSSVDFRIARWSDEATRMFGWTAQETLGKRIDELRWVHPDDWASVERTMADMLSGRRPRNVSKNRNLRKDGSVIHCEWYNSTLRDPAGQLVAVLSLVLDVTDRVQAEEALRESERRGRQKLDAILSPGGEIADLELADVIDAVAIQSLMDELHALVPIPMAVIDLAGKVLVGVGWSEVCTRFHRVNPETCKHCVESDTELSAGVAPGEFRLYKCKNEMWDVATPLSLGGHHVGNVFSGQFFFEDEPLDRDLFRAQAARYGFDEGQYLAALEAVPRVSRETVAIAMAFFVKLADMLSRLSYGNVSLARAISEREALMVSLRQSKERLEEADRRKDEYLGMLSHELRNPLAPIRHSVHLLQHVPPGGEQARRAVAVIDRQSAQLSRLVDDLLDVTRIARGKIELRRARVDLVDLVRRTGEDQADLMSDRGIELAVEVPGEPTWVDGDAVRLAQVVANLLQNSAKFTPAGGRVTLALEVVRGDAEIHVRDTGAGIEPELLASIWEPFVQAERTLARTSGGLGLGLALVKGLSEQHGGSARAASAGPGQGAEFVVRLPLARVDPEADGRAPGRAAPGARRRRVLVVDDNHDAAEVLAELVRLFGHDTEIAFDGPAALAKARASPPDLVLCDIGLPGMSGYDVARLLRAAGGAALELVAVSGYAQPDDVRRAIEAGFDRHLAKPLDPDALAALLA